MSTPSFDSSKYFHGKPCKFGHTFRRTSDRHCVACNAERNKKWRTADPERANARNRAWHKNNSEKSKTQGRNRYARRKATDPRKYMLQCAKHRAKVGGYPCTILVTDITIPEFCPLLGIQLYFSKGKKCRNSPSLDRILNAYGYVPGNVHVISNRANELKRDAQSAEMLTLAFRLAELETKARDAIVRG